MENMGTILVTGILGLGVGFTAGFYTNKLMNEIFSDLVHFIPHDKPKIIYLRLPVELENEIKNFNKEDLVPPIIDMSEYDSDTESSNSINFNNDPILRSKSPYSTCSTPIHLENPIPEIIENGKKLPFELSVTIFMNCLSKGQTGRAELLAYDIDEHLRDLGKYIFIKDGNYELYSAYNFFTYPGNYSKFSERIYLG